MRAHTISAESKSSLQPERPVCLSLFLRDSPCRMLLYRRPAFRNVRRQVARHISMALVVIVEWPWDRLSTRVDPPQVSACCDAVVGGVKPTGNVSAGIVVLSTVMSPSYPKTSNVNWIWTNSLFEGLGVVVWNPLHVLVIPGHICRNAPEAGFLGVVIWIPAFFHHSRNMFQKCTRGVNSQFALQFVRDGNNQQRLGSEYLYTCQSSKRKQIGSEFEIAQLIDYGRKA